MKLTSSASFSPSIRISLRLKIHQAQAKNFCRVLDIRVAEVMKAPASGGTAFDRAKAARKRARAAPVTHFIAGSRQNDCTRCAKKYPPFFVAAFDLTFVYVRLAAAPVGEIFLQRLLYWLRSSG
jgi:hypothetical protein